MQVSFVLSLKEISGDLRATLFLQIHGVIQIEPAGGLVAKFFQGRVVGVDLDLVLAWFEDHVAKPGFSAVMHALVVAQHLMNLIAVIALRHEDRLTA